MLNIKSEGHFLNSNEKYKFPRIFYYLMIGNFLFFLSNSMFFLFPNYLKNLDASETYIGVINNFDKILGIAVALSIGFFINKINKLNLLRWMYFATMFITYAYSLNVFHFSANGTSLYLTWQIPVLKLFQGTTFSFNFILASSTIFEILPKKEMTRGIAIFGISGALSQTIGPLIGEILLEYTGNDFYYIFLVSTIIMVPAFFIVLFVSMNYSEFGTKKAAPDNVAVKGNSVFRLFRYKGYLKLCIITLIFGGGFGTIHTFLKNYTVQLSDAGYAITHASYFLISYSVILIVLRLTVFNLFHNLYKPYLIGFACGFAVITFLGFYFLVNSTILVILGAMYGLVHGIMYPVQNSFHVEIVDEMDKSPSNAMFIAMFSIGMLSMSAILGPFVDISHNYFVAYGAAAVFWFVAMIISFTIMKDFPRQQEEENLA